MSNPEKINACETLSALYNTWLERQVQKGGAYKKVVGDNIRNAIIAGQSDRLTKARLMSNVEQEFSSPESRVKVWSDLHLFHNNIMSYSGRPYENTLSMNNSLLNIAKKSVKKDDWLLIIEDVSFGSYADTNEWLRKCPGRKILVLGNHDVKGNKRLETMSRNGVFEAVVDCVDWKLPFALETKNWGAINRLWFTH